jgi:hypothetical protein
VINYDGIIAINGRTYSLDTTEDQRITAKDNIVMKGKQILKN